MPFASRSQQRFMFATHPRMAKRWARETEDIKSLPEKVEEKEAVAQAFADEFEKISQVVYRGTTFPGYNTPISSNKKEKKKMVLVKRGDKVKLVHFGQKGYEDYTQHGSEERRKNYLTRSAGIRDGSGKLTKDDPFSPNYWARRKLW